MAKVHISFGQVMGRSVTGAVMPVLNGAALAAKTVDSGAGSVATAIPVLGGKAFGGMIATVFSLGNIWVNFGAADVTAGADVGHAVPAGLPLSFSVEGYSHFAVKDFV